jgi:hypothetical protein
MPSGHGVVLEKQFGLARGSMSWIAPLVERSARETTLRAGRGFRARARLPCSLPVLPAGGLVMNEILRGQAKAHVRAG